MKIPKSIGWVCLVIVAPQIMAQDLIVDGNLTVTTNATVNQTLTVNGGTSLTTDGRLVAGNGVDLANIELGADGSAQKGKHWGGTQSIISDASGAFQYGYNVGTQIIDCGAHGSFQLGCNYEYQLIGYGAFGAGQMGVNGTGGNMVIGDASLGSFQKGVNVGLMLVDHNAYGAEQSGVNLGTMVIDTNAHGSVQCGALWHSSSVATNSGIGSIQLLNLQESQTALMQGNASIGLGSCAVTNSQAIVAGDNQVSHGDGTVTAEAFYGDGRGLYIPQLGDISMGSYTNAP